MLYILTPIFCVGLCLGAVFSFSLNNNKVTANAATGSAPASILSLNGEFASKLQGGQKEYIYFGTNTSTFGGDKTGAIKWRVLSNGSSTNDNKYSSGNMLLWADYQLGANCYNSTGTAYENPNYAYWSTSRVRAALNGGYYASFVGNGTTMPATNSNSAKIETTASYYGKIFTEKAEQNAVVAADTYKTDNFGWNTTQSQFYLRDNITATAYSSNGKYNESILGSGTAKDAKKTTAGNLTAAGDGSTTAAGGGVQETTSGDKLFLLDYYDINSVDFGFVDSGLTYANKVSASWTTSSNSYPSYPKSSITWDTLQFTDSAKFYWLRQAGRVDTTCSSAMTVASTGMISSNVVTVTYGVRPAFNLNTNNVVYATAANVSGIGSTLSSVSTAKTTADGKPEYKVYVKDLDYKTDKAISILDNSTLKIAYKTPSNFKSGNLVLLLSNADGSVAYQAVQGASNNSNTTQIANFTLPSGVTFSDYTATLLFTSNNEAKAANSTETVYASYSLDGAVGAPSDINETYDSHAKWDSVTKASWYDEKIHGNEAFVKVKTIEYTNSDGELKTDKTYTTADIIDAGTYKVTLELAEGLKWSTEGCDGTFSIKIEKGEPKVTPKFLSPLPTYVPDELPAISLSEGDTAGTIAWDKDQQIKSGTNDYKWTFTPSEENKNNFKELHKTSQFTFEERAIEEIIIKSFDSKGKTVYTSTLASVIKSYMTVEVKYYEIEKTTEIKDFELQINNDNKLKVGDNKLKVKYNGKWSAEFTISGVEELTFTSIESITLSKNEFTYPVTAEQIIAVVTAVDTQRNDGTAYTLTEEEIKSLIVLADGSDLTAGTRDLTFKIKDTEASTDYPIIINKGTYEMSGITFGGLTMTYDGSAHKIEISGTLPEGVSVVYSVAGQTATEFTDAGTYEYTASFTHSNPNYNAITTTKTATLKIEQADYPDADKIKFENKTVTHTGGAQSIEATDVPAGVTVTYVYNGAEQSTPFEFTDLNESGYEVTAKFAHTNPNYKAIANKTATLIISAKPTYTITATFENKEVVYNGSSQTIAILGDLPDGVTVAYYCDGAEFTGATDEGEYEITAKFTGSDEYAPIPDKTATLKITAADYDMSGVTFEDKTVTYNGAECTLEIGGVALPEWITVSYSVEGQSSTSFTESGVYTFVAKFTHANANYNAIADKTATLTISDAQVTGVSAKVDADAKFDINNTLDDLKAKLSAEIEYNNGTKEAVEVDNLTVTCDTLRDGGKFEVGAQTITITYNDGTKDFTTTVEIIVAKAKVALLVYKGTLSYTGLELKPTANDFDGYNADLMSFNETKTIAGLNAGAYKAVFALKDSDRYEWATTTSLKKSVFATAVYDGETEITLEANEAAVDWNIAKAKISATKADGKLPVFASESYTGSLGEVIALKYYTDETCTEEVAADALGYNTNYYVRAVLSDEAKANFELDETSLVFAAKPFEYLTPEKELTFWEKVVKFLTSKQMGLVVWLWIVIALVALILLITIIALAAKSKKKKRMLEERKLAEEKEEKEREREERRLEREERMARMSQQQAMPQMMMPQMMPQMPMQQPQYAPQSQPVAMGGNGGGSGGTVSEAQFMQMQTELKAEISALKAAQESAKEIAELKAEMNAKEAALRAELNSKEMSELRNDTTYAKRDEQVGGISVDAMTEIMTMALKNVFMSATQQAIAGQPAQPAQLTDGAVANAAPAAAQVPPDAVMTTVTTTKIDTTKKAQGAQGNAQTTRQTRSFVPPMPVDDGRVFDVGGFYKPADPVDLVDDDVDNK